MDHDLTRVSRIKLVMVGGSISLQPVACAKLGCRTWGVCTNFLSAALSIMGKTMKQIHFVNQPNTGLLDFYTKQMKKPLTYEPDRDPPGQRPPGQRPPGQRPHWTETPWTETPLDRDPTGQRSPGQRPTPRDRDHLLLDRDHPGKRPPDRDHHPPPSLPMNRITDRSTNITFYDISQTTSEGKITIQVGNG